MNDHTEHPVPQGPASRPTDFAKDAATTEAHAPHSQRFEADTGARLKRGAIIAAIVLGVAFVLVSIDRYIKARAVARDTAAAAGAPPLVEVVSAQRVGAMQRLVLPGYTAAWHASTIYARVNGYVGNWYNDIGDHVHAGQVLAVIETPDLDAQLAAARAQLQADQAQVLVRKAEAAFSLTTYERWRDSPKGVVSEQEREEKRADYDSGLARLKSAEADVALAQARVNQYAALAEFKKVTAPYDGVISVRDIDIGNLVTAGSTSATTPLYVMTQNDPIRIFVDAPQSAAEDLTSNNAPVQVQTNGGVPRQYNGKVTRTSQAINPQARTLRVGGYPQPQGRLRPGDVCQCGFRAAAARTGAGAGRGAAVAREWSAGGARRRCRPHQLPRRDHRARRRQYRRACLGCLAQGAPGAQRQQPDRRR